MFFLTLIPLFFGYVLATHVVCEREAHLRLPLAYALGLSCFLFGVNAFFHVLSLRTAVFLTLGLMVAASVALWRLKASAAVWPTLGRLEAAVIITLTLTAFFRALFWQMKHSDDDFFPHAPLMALYLRDVFPPRNPFYPDQPYLGHYGRDLSISALSVLWGERFFAVQYIVTALNHAMTVLLAYFASRRFLRSPRQALLVLALVFLGLNPLEGRGLLDVFSNNNTFVHLILLLNAYLFLSAIRYPRLGIALLSSMCLATYSIVYTTHHGVLVVAFLLLTLAVLVRSRRWRLFRFGTAGVVVATSLAISLAHGGTLSDVGRRYLFDAKPRATDNQPPALVTQQVRITFPKGRLGFTAGNGTPYSLFSWRFAREAGFAAVLLPVSVPLLLFARRYWALLMGLVGTMAIFIPATVEFGAYENDTYRFLFLGSLGAAAALGATLGMGLDRVAVGGRIPAWGRLAATGLLLAFCWSSVAGTAWAFGDVARRPDQYFWRIADWACNGIHRDECDPVDASTAAAMRPMVASDQSILTNVYNEDDIDFVGQSVVGAFARAFVTGHGVKVRAPGVNVGEQYKTPAGFRALAFWNTGAGELLDDLHADWLLVDPSRLSAKIQDALTANPQLELAVREQDLTRGGVRDVYRVKRRPRSAAPHLPADLRLLSADLPPQMMQGSFAAVRFVVATRDPAFTGKMRVAGRVRVGAHTVNAGDWVGYVTEVTPAGPGRWSGTLLFVSPFERGKYTVEVTAGPDDAPLLGPADAPAVFQLEVM